jgi:hypothetical protein
MARPSFAVRFHAESPLQVRSQAVHEPGTDDGMILQLLG